MAFDLAVGGSTAPSATYNQLAGYFNGSSSYPANPIQLITLNDATNYVQSWKQNDTTNGRIGIFYKADGTVMAKMTKDGFRYSSDGTIANSDLTPVSISGAETITGAKTFSAATVFNSRVFWKRATSTASTAALTLPTDGNIVPISGTVTITSIVPTGLSGLPIILEFASAGCNVQMTSTLRLRGGFCSSAARDTLTLECDGTNWNEVARGRSATQGVLCQVSTSVQTLNNGDPFEVIELATADYDPFNLKTGNTFVVQWDGSWRAEGALTIDADADGTRAASIFVNGTEVAQVGYGGGLSDTVTWACSWSLPLVLAEDDIVDLRAKTASGQNRSVGDKSFFGLHYIGPA